MSSSRHSSAYAVILSALLASFGCSRKASSSAEPLLQARARFQTHTVPSKLTADGPAAQPPAGTFELIHYPAPPGPLVAYLARGPKDGKRHPALLWLKGGWGGIGDFLWEPGKRSQGPNPFREAGYVVLCPSYRGENDNPGRMEAFYGEVNDALAALDYLAQLPEVDPHQLYVAGHSTGGTMALLVAMASAKPRAVFSFGGRLDFEPYVKERAGRGLWPFDATNAEEIRLRNPLVFAGTIQAPVFFFEGEEGATTTEELQEMNLRTRAAGKPFQGYLVRNADHFTQLQPGLAWLVTQLATVTGPHFPQFLNLTSLQESVDREVGSR